MTVTPTKQTAIDPLDFLALDALVPLARSGELDGKVARVLAFRRSLGAAPR